MIVFLIIAYFIISTIVDEPESANRRFDTPYNRRHKY